MTNHVPIAVIKCVVCKRKFQQKVHNQMNCSEPCRIVYKARYFKQRRIDNYDEHLARARKRQSTRKYKATELERSRSTYLEVRERGALFRMYGTAMVHPSKRLKCALARTLRYSGKFTETELSQIKRGKFEIAYKRVRAQSKIQIKSTKGVWAD